MRNAIIIIGLSALGFILGFMVAAILSGILDDLTNRKDKKNR